MTVERREVLAGVMLAVLAIGGATMAQLAPSVFPGRETLIFTFGTLLAVLAVLALIVLVQSATTGLPKVDPKPAEAAAPRPASGPAPSRQFPNVEPLVLGNEILLADNVTPSFLMGLHIGRTDVQSEGSTAPYIGKRMKVSGTVVDVSKVRGLMCVSVTPVDCGESKSIYMIFEQDHERLSVVHPDDLLHATGRIKKIASFGIELQDCRLI